MTSIRACPLGLSVLLVAARHGAIARSRSLVRAMSSKKQPISSSGLSAGVIRTKQVMAPPPEPPLWPNCRLVSASVREGASSWPIPCRPFRLSSFSPLLFLSLLLTLSSHSFLCLYLRLALMKLCFPYCTCVTPPFTLPFDERAALHCNEKEEIHRGYKRNEV